MATHSRVPEFLPGNTYIPHSTKNYRGNKETRNKIPIQQIPKIPIFSNLDRCQLKSTINIIQKKNIYISKETQQPYHCSFFEYCNIAETQKTDFMTMTEVLKKVMDKSLKEIYENTNK